MGRLICLGEILFDLLALEPDTPWEQVSNWNVLVGGAPANVAFAYSRLGGRTAFLGCLGTDAGGQHLLEELRQAGVETDLVQLEPRFPSRRIYVERSALGERFFAGFGLQAPADFADAVWELPGDPAPLFKDCDLLLTGTLLLAFAKSGESVRQAIRYCVSHDIPVAMDINRRDVFWTDASDYASQVRELLPAVSIIKFSKEEAIWLFDTADPVQLRLHLPKAGAILVSDGENGSSWWIRNFTGHTSAYEVSVVDTTGAGDNFLAGFLFNYLEFVKEKEKIFTMQDAERIMRFASAMGALATTRAGAVTSIPSREEIARFLSDQNA